MHFQYACQVLEWISDLAVTFPPGWHILVKEDRVCSQQSYCVKEVLEMPDTKTVLHYLLCCQLYKLLVSKARFFFMIT